MKYLNTDPPNVRSKAVLPIHLLINEDDDPYFKDPVEKYMNRPTESIFDQVIYPEYFEYYIIQKSRPNSNIRNVYQDQCHQFLKITDGELYFITFT